MGAEPCRVCGQYRHFGGVMYLDEATGATMEDVFECQHCGDPTYWRDADAATDSWSRWESLPEGSRPAHPG